MAATGKAAEHNYVADAHNYEQRIKVENEAAQVGKKTVGESHDLN